MFPNLEYFNWDTFTYGLYGGLDYSAGTIGGTITGTSPPDPAPVDAYDAAFYEHDLAYKQTSDPVELLEAHVQVVEDVYGLLSDAVSNTASGWHFL